MNTKTCNLTPKKVLGEGGYGQVFEVENNNNRKLYAYKVLSDYYDLLAGCLETDVLFCVSNEYMLRGINVFSPSDKCVIDAKRKDLPGIELPLCNGDCFDLFYDTRGEKNIHRLDEVINLLYSITNALRCLHKCNFLFLDLKLENVLYVNEGGKKRYLLSDYGMCYPIKNKFERIILKKNNGTTGCRAPEAIKKEYLTVKSDIWSLGMMAYSCLFFNISYSSISKSKDKSETELDRIKKYLSPSALRQSLLDLRMKINKKDLDKYDNISDFITSLLKFDPNDRPYADEILEMKIFKDRHSKDVCEVRKDYNYPLLRKDENKILRSFLRYKYLNEKTSIKELLLSITLLRRLINKNALDIYPIEEIFYFCLVISYCAYKNDNIKYNHMAAAFSKQFPEHIIPLFKLLDYDFYNNKVYEKALNIKNIQDYIDSLLTDKEGNNDSFYHLIDKNEKYFEGENDAYLSFKTIKDLKLYK